MIIKKFNGKTEDEALKAARAELGAGAVIMNVKKVKKKGLASLFSKPTVEVTAAVEEEKDTYVPRTQAAPPMPAAPKKDATEQKISQYKDVLTDEEYEKLHPKKEEESPKRRSTDKIDNLQSLLEQQLKSVMEADAEEKVKSSDNKDSRNKEIMSFIKLIYTTLINNEVDEKYANDLVEEIEKLSKPGVTIDFLLSNIYQKLILKFGVSTGVTEAENGPKVIFFLVPRSHRGRQDNDYREDRFGYGSGTKEKGGSFHIGHLQDQGRGAVAYLCGDHGCAVQSRIYRG